jgi:hypothetical protein
MIIFIHGGNYSQDFVSEEDSTIHPLQDVEFKELASEICTRR